MKIKSLLAAVSMVAIAAGSAHAIDASYGTTPAAPAVPAGLASDFATALANEVDIANNPISGVVVLDLTLTSGGQYANGTLHDVVVTLPAGVTLNAASLGTDINAVDGGGVFVGNGSVFANGAIGDSTVTFQINASTSTIETFQVVLNVDVNACPTSGINGTVQVTGGSFVEGDSAGGTATSGAFSAMGCGSAMNSFVMADFPAPTLPAVLPTFPLYGAATSDDTSIDLTFLPAYSELDQNGVAVGSPTPSIIGYIWHALDSDYAVDATGTAMADTDVSTMVYTVNLPGNPATGGLVLTDLNFGNTASVISGGPVTWTVTVPSNVANLPVATSGGTTGDGVVLAVNTQGGGVVIPSMQPTVSAGTVTFAGVPFIANEAGATGNLDLIQREGKDFGFFDWNGTALAGQTIQVYRVTGLTGPTVLNLTLENSNANGPLAPITVNPDATGEVVLTSYTMGGALPAGLIRYDVGMSFETADPVDVDRVMFRNGDVSAFNDGANMASLPAANQPTGDSDNNVDE